MGNPIDVLGTDDFGTWPAILMLCGFLFFVVIILCASRLICFAAFCAECLLPRRMNVLIAIMADSYEMVKEHEKVEALHERAKMIADMELLHPGWHRYSEYMHICEAADEDSALEPEWSGVAGRVKVLLSDASSDIKAELRSDLAKAEDVAAMKLEMAKADDVAAMKTEMAKADDVAEVQSRVDILASEVKSDVAALSSDLSSLKEDLASVQGLLQTLCERTAA